MSIHVRIHTNADWHDFSSLPEEDRVGDAPETSVVIMPIVSRKEAIEKQLKRYFTGKPCPRGHICERMVSTRGCMSCIKIKLKVYTKSNRQRANEKHKRWRDNNAVHVLEQGREYRETHPELKGYNKSYREQNKEHIAETKSQYYEENKEELLIRMRVWRKENPEKRRELEHRRRARKQKSEGTYTPEDISRIYKLQKGKCAYCEESLNKAFQVDHIISLAKGGNNFPKNIQLLCDNGCNQKKRDRDPIDFARSLGKLL